MISDDGLGRRAPAPVPVRISQAVYRLIQTHAGRREVFRRYGFRSDAWGRGLKPNATTVGCVGEFALCDWLRRRGFRVFEDFTLRLSGDGGRDVAVAGLSIQVKLRRGNFGSSWVRAVDGEGRAVPFTADLFVFVQWSEPPNERPPAPALLLGWSWASDVVQAPLVESPVADHWNLDISNLTLLPMCRLADECRARSIA